jgi:hypothetical protein
LGSTAAEDGGAGRCWATNAASTSSVGNAGSSVARKKERRKEKEKEEEEKDEEDLSFPFLCHCSWDSGSIYVSQRRS